MELATWVLAFATTGLVIVTVGLFVITRRYSIATNKLVNTERLSIVNDIHRRIHSEKFEMILAALTDLDKLNNKPDSKETMPAEREKFKGKLNTVYRKLMDDVTS